MGGQNARPPLTRRKQDQFAVLTKAWLTYGLIACVAMASVAQAHRVMSTPGQSLWPSVQIAGLAGSSGF
jgi:hypothetical protein